MLFLVVGKSKILKYLKNCGPDVSILAGPLPKAEVFILLHTLKQCNQMLNCAENTSAKYISSGEKMSIKTFNHPNLNS